MERPDPIVLRSNIFTLQKQLRGNKTLDPTMKNQKYIPAKLVLHIYNWTNTNLSTSIGQLISGAFFFGMRYCEYSTTPKEEDTHTHILQKGDILFYRKIRELSHDSGILHLANKVPPELRTQKTGVKKAIVTQWRTATTLCLVRI